MKYIGIICFLFFQVLHGKLSKRDRQKSKRGTKIWGNSALPQNIENAQCSCAISANCWLVGDPHLKSFYNRYEKISYPLGQEFDIYTHEEFSINATTYGPDLMDNINFGSKQFHIDDCDGQGWIDDKIHKHTYSDESTIEARVYCKKAKGKMHINILLTKFIPLDESLSFEDHETLIGSSGECILK